MRQSLIACSIGFSSFFEPAPFEKVDYFSRWRRAERYLDDGYFFGFSYVSRDFSLDTQRIFHSNIENFLLSSLSVIVLWRKRLHNLGIKKPQTSFWFLCSICFLISSSIFRILSRMLMAALKSLVYLRNITHETHLVDEPIEFRESNKTKGKTGITKFTVFWSTTRKR